MSKLKPEGSYTLKQMHQSAKIASTADGIEISGNQFKVTELQACPDMLLFACEKLQNNEWISIDDGLPDGESGYNVRVYCHDIVTGWQQDLLFNGKIWIHDGGNEFEPIVTHWKPHSKNPK